MPKTLIDVDLNVLERARDILGTTTKRDTINAALHEVVRRGAAAGFLAHRAPGPRTRRRVRRPTDPRRLGRDVRNGRATTVVIDPYP
jgi:Arc/MetJ family transcription regulator